MNLKFQVNKKVIISAVMIIYVSILFGMHFIRIFDNNFWGDEAYSILISRKTWLKMVKITAKDVHPPLYYTILMFGSRLLPGYSWVYHFITVLAYGLVLIVAMTLIRKKLGNITAIIFITMASVVDCTLYLNVEVRMYTWAGFFVVMSYYFLREIMVIGDNKSYIAFVLFSLFAAYTHYYALVSVAFFYIMLMVWSIYKKDKGKLIKAFICYGVTIIAYLPWLIVLILTFLRTMDGYWMDYIPSVTGSLRFLFGLTCDYFNISKLLEVIFGVTVIYAIIHCVKEKEWNEGFWLFAGCLSIGGTIMTGELISHLFRPMYLERYLYPVALISWLILGRSISKIKYSKIITALLLFFILIVGIPNYLETYKFDKEENEIVEDFYSKIQVNGEQHILSDELGLTQAVLECYYKDPERSYINIDALPELDKNGDYWLFLSNGNVEEYRKWLSEYDFDIEERYLNGVLGTVKVDAYKIIKIKE